MSCVKCQTLPQMPNSAGSVIISCAVSELADKIQNYLSLQSFNYQIEDSETLWVTVERFFSFLEELCTFHNFTRIEREGISLLFLEENESLTPSKLKLMKTLQQYRDLIGAKELSTLIQKGALTAHFQPIVNLNDNTIYGYESLARGVSDEGNLIYPDTLFRWGVMGICSFTSIEHAEKHLSKLLLSKIFIQRFSSILFLLRFMIRSTAFSRR